MNRASIFYYRFKNFSIFLPSSMARRHWIGAAWLCLLALGLQELGIARGEPSAIIVFGDSTVDTGTNFYSPATPFNFQANRYPYGFKGFQGQATGRFTEGRVIIDFIAEYAGFPVVESYAKPDASLAQGANFGSGGAGALDDTNEGMVTPLSKQLENFADFCGNVSKERNLVEYEEFLSNAVYLISIGSNDYLSGYFSHPHLQQAFTPEQFVTLVVSNITKAIEVLHSKGARKIVMFGVGPLGCLPPLRIVNGSGGCHEPATALGQAHNYALGLAIQRLRQIHPDSIIVRAHFYDFFEERQNNFGAYGFKEPAQACCGAGPFHGRGHCGIESVDPELSYELCEEPSSHVWWDPYHPSERVHEQYAQALWRGNATVIEPVNLEQLFHSSSPSGRMENPGTPSFAFPEMI
ncbi:GDSL esterase/lipase 4 [Selaginella moellendorffii]|nr:GDSL esterase/lipase 4 [Selaginella moellendorffii]|eukprot:XP_002960993.2 GDSL esterase/lipase 4 [Selaginella moellendorffii]